MDFYNFTTVREAVKKAGLIGNPDDFYQTTFGDAVRMGCGQFVVQLTNERDWEQARRPYYNVWPAVVPMLTRLNLDLDSVLIRLPLPALCVRLPKAKNPLTFLWKGEQIEIRSMLMGDMYEGQGISILIDIGEAVTDGGQFGVPIYTYRNFRQQEGLTVEQALRELGDNGLGDLGIQIPESLITDCVRLCCSLCLLKDDPSIVEPDVLAKDRLKYEQTGDEKYVEKSHRRGKVGWNVGRHIEVAPHYRRPHMMLAWTGPGRAVPKIVPRSGSVVHRVKVTKVPTGYGG